MPKKAIKLLSLGFVIVFASMMIAACQPEPVKDASTTVEEVTTQTSTPTPSTIENNEKSTDDLSMKPNDSVGEDLPQTNYKDIDAIDSLVKQMDESNLGDEELNEI